MLNRHFFHKISNIKLIIDNQYHYIFELIKNSIKFTKFDQIENNYFIDALIKW